MKQYISSLKEEGRSYNTIKTYQFIINNFLKTYHSINEDSLYDYRTKQIKNYSIQTANLRFNAINSYIRFLKDSGDIPEERKLGIKLLKYYEPSYLENVITQEEYNLLTDSLYQNGDMDYYFLIRFLCSTGVRVSEATAMAVGDLKRGYKDVIGKGHKPRRIYIPSALAALMLSYLDSLGITDGPLFISRSGKPLSESGIRWILKTQAAKYGIPVSHAHPHALRHRFAINFLKKSRDLSMLSDLLGHESIETTRIYLRQTTEEQMRTVNNIVDW